MDGFRIEAVFYPMNSPKQRLLFLALPYRNRGLEEDWPVIYLLIHKMDCHSCHLHSVPDRIPNAFASWKSRQESRMDVEDPIPVSTDESLRQDPHETRQDNKTGSVPLKDAGQSPIEALPRAQSFRVNDHRRYPRRMSPLKRQGPRIVADDNRDPGQEAASADGPENRLQIRPLAGTADGDGGRHRFLRG